VTGKVCVKMWNVIYSVSSLPLWHWWDADIAWCSCRVLQPATASIGPTWQDVRTWSSSTYQCQSCIRLSVALQHKSQHSVFTRVSSTAFFLLLIYDAVHNAMMSQQCNTNPYCMVVLHACIHAPVVHLQPKPKIVCSVNGSTEYGKPTLDLQVALSASSKNTRCATSDVNPFKIRCNLQITKATVNETQWWHVINDVTNDVKLTSAIGVVLK